MGIYYGAGVHLVQLQLYDVKSYMEKLDTSTWMDQKTLELSVDYWMKVRLGSKVSMTFEQKFG